MEEETQGSHYNYNPAVCCCPHASQNQGEHLSITWTALCTVACNSYNFIFIFGNIHTVSGLGRETSVMHASLVSALFFKQERDFSLQACLFGGYVSWKQGFYATWGQCNVSEVRVFIPLVSLKHLGSGETPQILDSGWRKEIRTGCLHYRTLPECTFCNTSIKQLRYWGIWFSVGIFLFGWVIWMWIEGLLDYLEKDLW